MANPSVPASTDPSMAGLCAQSRMISYMFNEYVRDHIAVQKTPSLYASASRLSTALADFCEACDKKA